jgi:hypothetical protein
MSWRILDASRSGDSQLPALLISTAFRSDSYAVHLTDLTHIWSESLDRRDIFRRSQAENTSIDPRDGDQLHVLLDKIRLGIEGGRDTSLTLAVNDDAGRPGVTLSITVPLPGGLAPLEWPVNLTAASQFLLTDQLMIPLLEAQQMRMREMASLADILREKDHVIQKLVDNLESQGIQLGQVFPHAVGKSARKIDRKKAEEKVKGLRLFDIEAWRQGLEKEESRDIGQLAEQVFKIDGPSDLDIKQTANILKGPDNWWESIKGGTFDLSTGKPALHQQSKASKNEKHNKAIPKEEESTQEDDNFQVQATPPRLTSAAQKSAADQTIDESTDDDDDLDAPSQRSKRPHSSPPPPPPTKSLDKAPKKLGLVGGKREPATPVPQDDEDTTEGSTSPRPEKSHSPEKRTPSPAPKPTPAKPKRTLGRIGGKEKPPEPEATPEVKEPPKPSRGRLGQVGGKRKEATPAPADPELEGTAVSPSEPAVRAKKPGGAGEAKSKQDQGDSEEPRGIAVKQETEETKEPPPREASEERADKKREQLRMELEEKAKAAPAKKKRRF